MRGRAHARGAWLAARAPLAACWPPALAVASAPSLSLAAARAGAAETATARREKRKRRTREIACDRSPGPPHSQQSEFRTFSQPAAAHRVYPQRRAPSFQCCPRRSPRRRHVGLHRSLGAARARVGGRDGVARRRPRHDVARLRLNHPQLCSRAVGARQLRVALAGLARLPVGGGAQRLAVRVRWPRRRRVPQRPAHIQPRDPRLAA